MAKDKTTTIVQAGAKGGVSAVMPYVAIGVIGYIMLDKLKDIDIGFDPGNIAGSIVDSAGEAAGEVVNYITEKAGETVIFITETRDDIVETAKVETSITSREEQGQPWSLTPESTKQLHKYKGTPGNVVSNWIEQVSPKKVPTGVISEFKGTTKEFYGDYGAEAPKSKYVPSGLSGLSSAYVPKTTTKTTTKTAADWSKPSHRQRPEHLYPGKGVVPETKPKTSKKVTSKTGFTLLGDVTGRPY